MDGRLTLVEIRLEYTCDRPRWASKRWQVHVV
jgi:hypothetical protein